jgi:hypothetical protein
MAELLAKSGAGVDRSIACETCRELAGKGGGYFEVRRAFRTPNVSGIGVSLWELGAVCRVRISPPNEGEGGEWGYPKHAYLEHPTASNTYALLCAQRHRVGRKVAGDGRFSGT